MTTNPRARDLEADLVEQLEFLASSCSGFDNGALSESKRIAVAIRVLVHDTPRGKGRSLLRQLGIKETLEWADSAPIIDDNPQIVGRSPGLTGMGLGTGGMV